MNTISGIPLMSDVLGLLRYSQKPEYCFCSLKVDMSMMPAALFCTDVFRAAPTSLTVPGEPAPPREEWRSSGLQVEGDQTGDPFPRDPFPEKLLHSVDCAGEFEEALFQLDLILATPRHSHSPHHQTVAS